MFWVKADEIANLDLGYKRISLALRLEEEHEFKSQVVSNEIVKRWLSNPQDYTWITKYCSPAYTSFTSDLVACIRQRR